jgi:hypothetical protein
MTQIAYSTSGSEPLPSSSRIGRVFRLRWTAVVVILAGMALPDCCLNGRHALGPGMEIFGSICRANL